MAKLAGNDYNSLSTFLGSRYTRKIGNNTTATRWANDLIRVELHGHPIVDLSADGRVAVSLAGYPTVTTRDRINSLLPAGFVLYQKDWEQYLSTRTGEIIPLNYREWITCDDVSGVASHGLLVS